MLGPLSTLATDYAAGEINGGTFAIIVTTLCFLHAAKLIFFPAFLLKLRPSFLFSLDGIKIIIFINYKQLSLHGVLRVNSLVQLFFALHSSSSTSTTTFFEGRLGRLRCATEPLFLADFGVVGGNSKSRSWSSVKRSL